MATNINQGTPYQGTSFERYTYGGGEWNSALNNPPSKNNNNSNKNQYETVIGVGQQTFRCTCWGLKPNTLHKPFLLTKEMTADCAPIANGSGSSTYTYGSSLISTADGKLVFDFRFIPQNSPYPTRQILDSNNYVAIIPVGQQQFKVSSVDGKSHAQSFILSKSST